MVRASGMHTHARHQQTEAWLYKHERPGRGV